MSQTTESKTATKDKPKGEISPSMLGSEILVSALEREGVDTIFAYPGVGRAIFESVGRLDFPVLQGAFVLLAATVVVANLLTDLAYGALDPRVRAQ